MFCLVTKPCIHLQFLKLPFESGSEPLALPLSRRALCFRHLSPAWRLLKNGSNQSCYLLEGFPKLEVHIGSPHSKVYSTLGSKSGSPIFRELPFRFWCFWILGSKATTIRGFEYPRVQFTCKGVPRNIRFRIWGGGGGRVTLLTCWMAYPKP